MAEKKEFEVVETDEDEFEGDYDVEEPPKVYQLTPEEMLSEVESGQKVSIARRKPKWADTGWLDTIPVPDGVGISLEDIKETFGGGYFEIRVLRNGKYAKSFMVEIGGPPRNMNGAIAVNPDLVQPNQGMGVEQMVALVKMMQPPQTVAPDTALIVKMMENSSNQNNILLTAMMAQNQNQNQNQNKDGLDVSGILGSIEQLKELSSMFGGNTEPVETEDPGIFGNPDLISQVMGMFDKNSPKKSGVETLMSVVASLSPEEKEEAIAKLTGGLGESNIEYEEEDGVEYEDEPTVEVDEGETNDSELEEVEPT